MGASLLVFLNKTDVEGCMDENEVRQVCFNQAFQMFPLGLVDSSRNLILMCCNTGPSVR